MNIARMEKFEQLWGLRHDLPAESIAQYRFESREGYRLPELAAHYRTFVETWDMATAEAAESCEGCFMAEVESLRKDAERYRWIRNYTVDSYGAIGSFGALDREIDEGIIRCPKP